MQGISGPQKFQIHKAYGAPDRLPSAHTWSVGRSNIVSLIITLAAYYKILIKISAILSSSFNQLDLPEYTTKEQLQDRLLLAIHEASEGFGFG